MNKVMSFIGIGQKANTIKSGEYKSLEAIKHKKAFLIIIAEDSSENTKKKFKNLSINYNIEFLTYGSKEELGKALGKEVISVIVITDKKFSDTLKNKM